MHFFSLVIRLVSLWFAQWNRRRFLQVRFRPLFFFSLSHGSLFRTTEKYEVLGSDLNMELLKSQEDLVRLAQADPTIARTFTQGARVQEQG